MTRDSERRRRAAGREAAKRYVEADANPEDREREAALVEWLERSPEHEAAFERCEAAAVLARELAARGELDALRTAERGHVLALLGRPAVAWGVAVAAVIWAVAASVDFGAGSESVDDEARLAAAAAGDEAAPRAEGLALSSNAGADDAPDLPAAEASVADAPPAETYLAALNPVAVLPGDIVVDVHSVAVLPFDGASASASAPPREGGAELAAAARIAAQLHDDVLRQLARIPGLYVVDGGASTAYTDGELDPGEIAALLSVRGVVTADVEVDGRTVRVNLRMTDAASSGRRTETIERPIDELAAVRTAIVMNITDSLDAMSF